MPPPKDTTQLQSFLGMVNFMHNFIPHLSEHTATLRELLIRNAILHWDESTSAAFQKLKSLIAEAQKRSLKFYNRNLPLTVQADASKHGLVAALLQQGEPVAARSFCSQFGRGLFLLFSALFGITFAIVQEVCITLVMQ